jgi:hypothetical protein
MESQVEIRLVGKMPDFMSLVLIKIISLTTAVMSLFKLTH